MASARAHFLRHGFEKARLAAIASDADIAVGTIYLRYSGKEALLAAVLASVEYRFVVAMQEPRRRGIPWPDRLRSIFDAVLTVAEREPDLARLMALAPFALAEARRPGDAIRAEIETELREARTSGNVRPDLDPSLGASLSYGLVEGALGHLMARSHADRTSILDELDRLARAWLTEIGSASRRESDPQT